MRLLELNVVDKILPLMEDPTNTHLFHNIYAVLHLLSDYANMNGMYNEKRLIFVVGSDSLLPQALVMIYLQSYYNTKTRSSIAVIVQRRMMCKRPATHFGLTIHAVS